MKRLLLGSTLAVFCLSVPLGPASAQGGAMWVDRLGRMMSLQFGGGNGALPEPINVPADEMARRFKAICLDSGGVAAETGKAAAAAGLAADPFVVPAGKNSVTLNIWRGPGTVVSQTGGFFAAPNAQCSVTFYVVTQPAKQDVIDALSRVIGVPPSNTAAANDKAGKPNRFYTPEWTVSGPGDSQVVYVFAQGGTREFPGTRVQITARDPKKAGK